MVKMTKELNQESADTYYSRGLAYSKNGELDKAIQDYTNPILRTHVTIAVGRGYASEKGKKPKQIWQPIEIWGVIPSPP